MPVVPGVGSGLVPIVQWIVLPLLVWFFEPKFLKRTDLMVGENIDLTQFAAKVDGF